MAADTSQQGLEIQVELKRQRHTQLWLLGELKKRGITNLDDKLLSRILVGRYPYKLGREVLAAAEDILNIEESITA